MISWKKASLYDTGISARFSYRLERADEAINAASLLMKNGMLTSSMNRIYYAMFYSVQALFVLHGVSFSKHGKVKGYFNREFIKNGKIPVNYGKLYNKAFEYRQKFDYIDFVAPDAALVSDYIENAKAFLEHIGKYIQSNLPTQSSDAFRRPDEAEV
ncbi:MAG: HEPN domain-containing protein [Pseudomonadota bacterium]